MGKKIIPEQVSYFCDVCNALLVGGSDDDAEKFYLYGKDEDIKDDVDWMLCDKCMNDYKKKK